MGVKNIRAIAPDVFIPDDFSSWDAKSYTDVKGGIKGADIIYTLRIQKERMTDGPALDIEHYNTSYGITADNISVAASDVIIMHPGPINRGIEIESSVADGAHSVIMQQIKNGVAIRMALLDLILN